jgi:hypothetical protein
MMKKKPSVINDYVQEEILMKVEHKFFRTKRLAGWVGYWTPN